MTTFAEDLKQTRADRIPRMALRPDDPDGDPMLMDDVVVKDVQMFRMEAMSDDEFWIACYFPNGEQVVFWAHAYHEKGKRTPLLKVTLGDTPREWIDIDSREHHGNPAGNAPASLEAS